jgi:predicted DNA-binding WGR domain protein
MKQVIKKVDMQCTEDGHSKEWHITQYEDNLVITEWGKINSTLSSKEFPFETTEEAEAFLNKKVAEKTKKGYLFVSTESN